MVLQGVEDLMANLKRTVEQWQENVPVLCIKYIEARLIPRRGGALRVELLSNVTEGNKFRT